MDWVEAALVTGGDRGIGRAICLRLARGGYAVGVNYCQRERAAQEVVDQIRSLGGKAAAFQADVSQRNQAQQLIEEANRALGSIQLLVNNAGVSWTGLFQDMTQKQWEQLLGVNLNGTVYCCQSVLPSMIRQQKGAIVNLSSIWGITGASCEAGYSAVKAAVIGLTKALAKEVCPSGIRVNCVAPGAIDTEMNSHMTQEDWVLLKEETPLGRIGRPEDIAEAVWFLATNGFVTGQVLSPNGGIVI